MLKQRAIIKVKKARNGKILFCLNHYFEEIVFVFMSNLYLLFLQRCVQFIIQMVCKRTIYFLKFVKGMLDSYVNWTQDA